MEHNVFQPVSPRSVKLLPGILQQRFDLNLAYLLSLSNARLLHSQMLARGL